MALKCDSLANTNSGCIYPVYGCTDPGAFNYDPNANTDDGTCIDAIYGCTDQEAANYDYLANIDDDSCLYEGCTDDEALNFNPEADIDDGMIIDEDIILEIVKPGTNDRVPDGEVGEVVVTVLNNYELPIVRFATGDLSTIIEGQSKTGRTYKRIKGWLGRADQTTKVRGMFVQPS